MPCRTTTACPATRRRKFSTCDDPDDDNDAYDDDYGDADDADYADGDGDAGDSDLNDD